MPRSFLLEAKIDPEKDFKRIAYSGAHDATIASVVSGKVDAAALDITVWKKFVDRKQGGHQGSRRVLHHPGLLQLQLVGARRHACSDMQAKVKAALIWHWTRP
jgi:phosphonate transport system substrate-binding protein